MCKVRLRSEAAEIISGKVLCAISGFRLFTLKEFLGGDNCIFIAFVVCLPTLWKQSPFRSSYIFYFKRSIKHLISTVSVDLISVLV